jgi:3-methyladenine DNA glycosylase AlkD
MDNSITRDLHALANDLRAQQLAKYFQTHSGGYGEGDIFIGLTVPQMRAVSKKYKDLPYGDIEKLLRSPIHEYRLTALFILVLKFENNSEDRKRIVDFYLAHTTYINNWDLVDASAPYIIGPYFEDKARKPIYTLVASKNVWERRIAIVATMHFIKKHQFADTFAICEQLIYDKHDLIHKACGWMLREVAKQNKTIVENWLVKRIQYVPRTTLRYAIERFPEKRRKEMLNMR